MEKKILNQDPDLSGMLETGVDNILSSIIDSFPDIIHSVDEKGRIVFVNKKATLLLGYSREELLGKDVFEIYADEVVQAAQAGFKRLKEKGVIDRIESKMKTKSGEVIDVEIRSVSLYTPEGKFKQTFTITRDIRELNQLKSILIQQSKLAGIGELAAGILHDVRNPLSLIYSYNGVFLKRAIESLNVEELTKCQRIIEKSTNKIMYLVDHLRDYSRIDEMACQKLNLADVVGNSLLLLTQKIVETRATIINKVIGKEAFIYGDENQLEQVFINIIGNACDAVSSQDDRSIVIDFRGQSDLLEVLISDCGIGIKPEHLDKIFESFFTTKKKGAGTGLGLSISKGIVEKHHGDIRVESILGKGTTFICSFPRQVSKN